MWHQFGSRLTFANVASALALFMAIGGGGAVAIGAIGGSAGTIKACYVKKGNPHKGTSTGEVQLLLKGNKCDKGEKAFSLNAQGGQGVAGVPGSPGANGANGSARGYGFVSGQGDVDTTRSSSGVTADRLGTGDYCIHVPGVSGNNTVIVPVVTSPHQDTAIDVVSGCATGSNTDFHVQTYNGSNALDDAGFNFVIP